MTEKAKAAGPGPLNWYKDLYLDKITGREKSLKESIEKGTRVLPVYVVALMEDPFVRLEFFSFRELGNSWLRDRCRLILGLASSRSSAMEMTQRILDEVLQKTGKPDPGAYYL